MVMKRPTYDSQPSRRIRKSTEPNYYLLIRSKRYCHLCANYSVPRHLLEVDHYYNDNNKYDLRENVKPLQRDDPENLWVLCKYCHSRKNHWESIGDYFTIERLKKLIQDPVLQKELRNQSNIWISEHQSRNLRCCERDIWVIPEDQDEPFYKPGK